MRTGLVTATMPAVFFRPLFELDESRDVATVLDARGDSTGASR